MEPITPSRYSSMHHLSPSTAFSDMESQCTFLPPSSTYVSSQPHTQNSSDSSSSSHSMRSFPLPLPRSPLAMLRRHAAGQSSPLVSNRRPSNAFSSSMLTDSLTKRQYQPLDASAQTSYGQGPHARSSYGQGAHAQSSYREGAHSGHCVNSTYSNRSSSSCSSSSSASSITSLHASCSQTTSHTLYTSQSSRPSQSQVQAQEATLDQALISLTPTPRFALMDPPSRGQAVFQRYRHNLSHTRTEGRTNESTEDMLIESSDDMLLESDDDDGDDAQSQEQADDGPVEGTGTVDPHHVQSRVYTPTPHTTPTSSTHRQRQYRLSASPCTPVQSTRYSLPYAYGSDNSGGGAALSTRSAMDHPPHSSTYISQRGYTYGHNWPTTPSPTKRRRFDLRLPLPSTLTPLVHPRQKPGQRHRNILSSLDSPTTLQAKRSNSAISPMSPLRLCASSGYQYRSSSLASPTRKSVGAYNLTPPQLLASGSYLLSTSDDEDDNAEEHETTSNAASEADEDQLSICGDVRPDAEKVLDVGEGEEDAIEADTNLNECQVKAPDVDRGPIANELQPSTNTSTPCAHVRTNAPTLRRAPKKSTRHHHYIPVRRSKRLRGDSHDEDSEQEEAQLRRVIAESIKDAQRLDVLPKEEESCTEDNQDQIDNLDEVQEQGADPSVKTEEADTVVAPCPVASTSSVTSTTASSHLPDSLSPPPRRSLPSHVELDTSFPGFYTRYKVPCQVPFSLHASIFPPSIDATSSSALLLAAQLSNYSIPSATRNDVASSLSPLNLYTPRYVRGVGMKKEGLCPICFHSLAWTQTPAQQRSFALTLRPNTYAGAWFKMKISAYNYHMHVHHGINHHTGLPLDPPVQFRSRNMDKKGKGKSFTAKGIGESAAVARDRRVMKQGLCHACKKWIDLQSVKEVDVKVPEIYWRKHAAKCHKSNRLVDESDEYGSGVFVDDELYRRVVKVLKCTDTPD